MCTSRNIIFSFKKCWGGEKNLIIYQFSIVIVPNEVQICLRWCRNAFSSIKIKLKIFGLKYPVDNILQLIFAIFFCSFQLKKRLYLENVLHNETSESHLFCNYCIIFYETHKVNSEFQETGVTKGLRINGVLFEYPIPPPL